MSRVRLLLASLLCLALAPLARTQSYTSILVFGDSLSDTGNFAHVAQAQYLVRVPGPIADYTDGRFTDGTDTTPAAHNYTGLWIEQLAATLPAKPAVLNSLNGGTNYAYGFANTGTGTSTYTLTSTTPLPVPISISVNNIGQQVTDYLTAHPTIPANTLVVVWGGANDILAVTSANASTAIAAAVTGELTAIQRLVAAGARDILVPNVPPLGAIPRLNTNAALSGPATAASVSFNTGIKTGLASLISSSATGGITLNVFQLDVFSLVAAAIGPPISGFANVTSTSQNVSGINPDTYLFWDDLHPTTAGHHAIAVAAASLIAPAVATTTVVTSSALTANVGDNVTFTANVSATFGSPAGMVSFYDGTTVTPIGTAPLVPNGTLTSAASFSTTTLAAGPHTITASFGGSTGFAGSTSAAITETIVAPSFAAALSPTTLTIASGSAGSSTVTVTPAGGYAGSIALTCGSLPAQASCVISPASLTFTSSSSAAQSAAVKISTSSKTPATAALLLFPLGGLGMLFALRRRRSHPGLLLLLLILSGAGLFGFTGCGGGSGSSNNTPVGTYPVVITVKPSTGAASTLNLSLVVQ